MTQKFFIEYPLRSYFNIGELDVVDLDRNIFRPTKISSNLLAILHPLSAESGVRQLITCEDGRHIGVTFGEWSGTGVNRRRSYNVDFLVWNPDILDYETYAFDANLYYFPDPNADFYDAKYFNIYYCEETDNYYSYWRGATLGVDTSAHEIGSTSRHTFKEWLVLTEEQGGDPFTPGGTSGTGGGNGNWDIESDEIDLPGLPSLGAQSTGLVTLYTPSSSQLASLTSYLWTDDAWDWDSFKKTVANPMDCMISLSIMPFPVPTIGSKEIMVGNLGTGVVANRASSQFVEVNCGSLQINEFSGSYLDYAPYTKAEIYLPYIGMRSLDVDDIMDRAVSVIYHCDVLTGSCVAFILVNGSVLYSYEGMCGVMVPLVATDFSSFYGALIGSVGSLVQLGTGMASGSGAGVAAGAVNSLSSAAGLVQASKPAIQRGSSISSTNGAMGVQKPYITFTRPKQCLPESQDYFDGYPSFITMQMGQLSGYNKIYNCHLDGIPATDAEKNEIEGLLKGGVIF